MNEIQEELYTFTEEKALPYLLKNDRFKPYINDLSFILVGSVATGLCHKKSDVDIAIVCRSDIYEKISISTPWDKGRPTEEIIDSTQLHYYALTFEQIIDKFNNLDDIYLYVYSNIIILRDPKNNYKNKISSIDANNLAIKQERIEGKIDMLMRRIKVLKIVVNREEDIITVTELILEVIKRIIKVIALLDDIPFDSRKRLFKTALKGQLGKELKDSILYLLSSLGKVEHLLNNSSNEKKIFTKTVEDIFEKVSRKAKSQNYKVGLNKIDRRQIEV